MENYLNTHMYESVGDENSNQGYLSLIAGDYQPPMTAATNEEREAPNMTSQEIYCSNFKSTKNPQGLAHYQLTNIRFWMK